MKNLFPNNVILRGTACAAALILLSIVMVGMLRAADKPAANGAPAQVARDLQGTWVHVGEPGKAGEAPAKGGFIKLRTARHWVGIVIDARTGLVTSTHGGTWKTNGGEYQETTEYGGEYQSFIMNKTFNWKLKVEGDTMTMEGIDNPWHEVWKRVK